MKYKLIKLFTILTFIILIFTVIIWSNFTIITKSGTYKDKVGIIDKTLSTEYNAITYSNNTSFKSKKVTHGDKLVSFVRDYQDKARLYYFDASNEFGEIDTNTIIEGLVWMIYNGVKRVNISYSNSIKHTELESWIAEHEEITVYASYNNLLNSFDYPAMYVGVFASGSNPKILYKKTDIKYKSNKIILLTNTIKYYHGNSFLSVMSMLK